MNFTHPRAMVFARPSGDLPVYTNITISDHVAPTPRVREVQMQLLGTGFPVGAQGADGIPGTNTARSLEAFARWYNNLPERPMANPQDLSRGPRIAVDRLLTPEKQVALQRFAARASEQLSSLQQTIIERPAPPAPPVVTPTPWLAIAGGTVALVTLVAFVSYANSHSKRRADKA